MTVKSDDVKWVVNDLGELGVEVFGRVFFLYKGGSLEYEDGLHSDEGNEGKPVLYRPVGKREFGECCHPAEWMLRGRSGPYPYTEGEGWRPLPRSTGRLGPSAIISVGDMVVPRDWAIGFGLQLGATPSIGDDGITRVGTRREIAGVLDGLAAVIGQRSGTLMWADPEPDECFFQEVLVRAEDGLEGWAGVGAVVPALSELKRAIDLAWEAVGDHPASYKTLAANIKRLQWALEAAERSAKP